jgi:pimeloyl-ACP methyl ester carboxylesterase
MSGNNKPLIVMVHGAWHWGGCFQKVADLLAQRGYPVATPDLKSHGYDATPYSAVTGMADYCAPAENIILNASEPVVLLGHSLGGTTVSYLGEKHPRRIRRLIYLAAYMCGAGRSVFDYSQLPENAEGEGRLLLDPAGPQDGAAIRVDDVAQFKSVFYADCSERDVRVSMANASRVNPLAPMLWQSTVTAGNFGSVPRAYIECTQDRSVPLALQRRFQQDLPGAEVRALASSHSPFFSQPEALADIIAELA